MARRGGKAASRKARQRNVPRQPRPAAPRPAPEPVADASETVAGSAGAVSDVREPVPAAPPRRPAAFASAGAGSSLSARDRAEYHYVERDLRNIGILTAIMAALLFGAWLLFTSTGLV